jgi:hydroxyethylthiazole kinase-like uncharacterized protein yjeF
MIYRPPKDSHKGQNGKLLVIGGSELFHAAALWTAEAASRIVDLVHFSSPALENNDLMRVKAKNKFWNGIVVPWEKVEDYITEDDAIVMGPGMTRSPETKLIVNRLLEKYPSKKWVIDGGALQEVAIELIPKTAILTPHKEEFQILLNKLNGGVITDGTEATEGTENSVFSDGSVDSVIKGVSKRVQGATILLKGVEDTICNQHKCVKVAGGNEGMTKGGTGDVLAGLVGALYCKNEAFTAAVTGSQVNKKAGDRLYARVGPYFNATDLVNEIPVVMKEL